MRHFIFALVALIGAAFMGHSQAQTSPFEISLEPALVEGLGGIQSYAIGQHDGKWLIVGGRLDGLHRRQPWAAFDVAGHNNQLLVVDPAAGVTWSAPLTSLPVAIQEQLSSTNMQYYQEGDYLYCMGGYGYSATEGDHTTFDKLTAIRVPEVIQAVIDGSSFTDHFRQVTDARFQVTGGRAEKIYDTFYLLGGQKFLGRYNPMGPDHGPGFIQEYTDAIRRFTIEDNGVTLNISHLASYQDSINLHRRDYNAEPQILPNGQEGVTMFSGVFQRDANLPFLNSVTVDSMSYAVNNSFNQYYNHYHCPVVPLYSSSQNEMHNIFFGGIAQFYDDGGTLVQDDDVPFVKTIARVTRDASGNMTETKLAIEMPSLLGAGADFIPNPSIPAFSNGVLKLDSLSTTEATHIGYIFGGISSSQPNIFFINDGNQSAANNQLFNVFLKRTNTSSIIENAISKNNTVNLKLYPNPVDQELHISFILAKAPRSSNGESRKAHLLITNENGVLVEHAELYDLKLGLNTYRKDISALKASGTYLITLETEAGKETKKLMIKR